MPLEDGETADEGMPVFKGWKMAKLTKVMVPCTMARVIEWMTDVLARVIAWMPDLTTRRAALVPCTAAWTLDRPEGDKMIAC